jgi:arginine deiminase
VGLIGNKGCRFRSPAFDSFTAALTASLFLACSLRILPLLARAGLPVIGEIEAPGFLEGGDFFSAGRDLAMVGIGLRSNFEACRQLMERDLLGTRRLAIVRDEYEQHQVRAR